MHLRDDHAEDVEERALGRVLPRHDGEQGVTLLGGGPLINDRLCLTVALVERTGKVHGDEEAQAIEPDVLEVAFADAHPQQALARPVGWSRVEITGTAEGTAAVLDPFAFKVPIS